MQRYKVEVEYDGTTFVGWQFQKNGLSIQEILQQAIFNFSMSCSILPREGGVHLECKFFL